VIQITLKDLESCVLLKLTEFEKIKLKMNCSWRFKKCIK